MATEVKSSIALSQNGKAPARQSGVASASAGPNGDNAFSSTQTGPALGLGGLNSLAPAASSGAGFGGAFGLSAFGLALLTGGAPSAAVPNGGDAAADGAAQGQPDAAQPAASESAPSAETNSLSGQSALGLGYTSGLGVAAATAGSAGLAFAAPDPEVQVDGSVDAVADGGYAEAQISQTGMLVGASAGGFALSGAASSAANASGSLAIGSYSAVSFDAPSLAFAFGVDPFLMGWGVESPTVVAPQVSARSLIGAEIEARLSALDIGWHSVGVSIHQDGASAAEFIDPIGSGGTSPTITIATAQKEILAMAIGDIGTVSIFNDLVPEDGEPLTAQVYGGSAAVGDSALTTGDVQSVANQTVSADVVSAQAQFSAQAQGAAAGAEAITGGGASGADVVIIAKYDESISRGDGTTEQYSGTVVHAVNYPGFDFAGGPIISSNFLGGGFDNAGLVRSLDPGISLSRYDDNDLPSNALAGFNTEIASDFGADIETDNFVATETTENSALSVASSSIEVF